MTPIDSIVARLTALHPKRIDLSLDRIERLLAALDHPERHLPPVIHVAGTNGKGSTIAFLRAILEAGGKARAHLHLAASGAFQRALPPRRGRRRPARLRRGTRRRAGGMRARQRRRAHHRVRDHHRGRPVAVRAPSGGHAAAGSRPRRPARRHQCHRASARQHHHPHLDRPHRFPGRQPGEDRRREGRHPQARRAGDRRRAAPRRARA